MSESFEEWVKQNTTGITESNWEYHILKTTWNYQQKKISELLIAKSKMHEEYRSLDGLYKSVLSYARKFNKQRNKLKGEAESCKYDLSESIANNKTLTAEIAEFKEVMGVKGLENYRQMKLEIETKDALIKELIEVVEFYGDKESQLPPIYKGDGRGKRQADFTAPYRMDSGKKARTLLGLKAVKAWRGEE